MTKLQKKTALIKALKNEIGKSLLLGKNDKKFWLENADTLPDVTLENVIKIIKVKNAQVEAYLKTAIAKDKDHKYLIELKSKIKHIKQKALSIEEEIGKNMEEEKLKKELKDI